MLPSHTFGSDHYIYQTAKLRFPAFQRMNMLQDQNSWQQVVQPDLKSGTGVASDFGRLKLVASGFPNR